MIDLKQELQDYRVISLNDNQAEIPDNIRNSVFLYNKAIESLRTGSEDIAIIELKKAISMNPHFYEAMNLLGICYSYANDYDRAAEVFDRVIKAEQNSVKALRYLSMLNRSEDDSTNKSKKRNMKPNAVLVNNDIKSEKAGNNSPKALFHSWIRYLCFFASGMLLAFLIQTIALKPEKIEENPTDNTAVKTEDSSDEYKKMYEKLDSEYQLLQKDKNAASESLDYYKSVIKLYEIESLVSKKQTESAADLLLLMRTADFKGDDKVKFDSLYKSVMPAASWIVYNEGYKLYNTKKYQESLKKLGKVEVYDPEFSRMDAVLYYMGRSYQLMQDSRNAIALFQRLIDSHPGSNYAANAKVRIKALTQIP